MDDWLLGNSTKTTTSSQGETEEASKSSKTDNGYYMVIHKMENPDKPSDVKLDVYDRKNRLLVSFPACVGKNKGNKQRQGDKRTPVSPEGKPFKVTHIQDSSEWKHDFKDGRGSIKCYGKWFLRLSCGNGIGIHGNTNNEGSVPGRASDGCIRLRDADIITLKEKDAYVGMPVIIKEN